MSGEPSAQNGSGDARWPDDVPATPSTTDARGADARGNGRPEASEIGRAAQLGFPSSPGRTGLPDNLKMRLVRWFFFTALAGVMPIAFVALGRFNRNQDLHLADLFGKGDMALISVGISLAAAGEALVVLSGTLKLRCFGFGSLSVILAVIAAWYYGDATRGQELESAVLTAGPAVDPLRVAIASLVFYLAALIVGTFCIFASEPESVHEHN